MACLKWAPIVERYAEIVLSYSTPVTLRPLFTKTMGCSEPAVVQSGPDRCGNTGYPGLGTGGDPCPSIPIPTRAR